MIPDSYLNRDKLPFPFCPGCSHGQVLDRLDEAMIGLKLDASKVVVVTDIGCVGLSDQWFSTHAFHGLHGRSVVYGEGLKLASPDLQVVVLIGDGGAGIGLHHILHAAKRNIGITVVLFNNMNFGMTGGEHSITTPEGSITSTTRGGHFERPLRLCETLRANQAPFVARRAYYDGDLAETLGRAIAFEGFSFVEVLELCVAYYVPLNKLNKKRMEEILSSGTIPRMTAIDHSRPEYGHSYRNYCRGLTEGNGLEGPEIRARHHNSVSGKLDVVICGSAGMKISSTATVFARGALLSGLYAVQRDDYPVTVRTGHSLAYVKLSDQKIGYMGVKVPDVLFVLSKEGLSKASTYFPRMSRGQRVYILSTLPEIETAAAVIRVDLGKLRGKVPKDGIALTVLSAYIESQGIFDGKALTESIELNPSRKIVDKQLRYAQAADPIIFDR